MNPKTRRRSPKGDHFSRAEQHVTGRQVLGAVVPFAAAAPKADGWTVLAYEVAMSESEVRLTRRDFEECVKNFAAYPCSPVTIEHADTMMFGEPSWAEPHGHVEEIRVGTMQRAGADVATLEGRVSYLPPTDAEVAAKKWRFGSITIIQGAVSEETGAKLGSMLWSWSLTAHPRLMGLPAIAASARAPGALVQAGYWYGDIDDRDDLLTCLRDLFDLPVTTDEAGVLAELAKLEDYVTDPATAQADGVETDHIVCQIRDALRLPALTSAVAVIAEVRKGLATLPNDDMPPTPDAATDPATMHSTLHTEKFMKFNQIIAALGLPAVASEDDAEKKLTSFARLGADTLGALGLPLTASPADVAARTTALSTAAARVPVLEQELVTFRAERDAREKADRAAHLDDLVAARPELATVRASLELHASTDWKGFQASYPRPDRTTLVTAAAESAQRAQDAQRTTQVTTTTAANPATKDAPRPAATPKNDRESFAAVLVECGIEPDALTITDAIAKGHTPDTLRAALTA